METIRQKGGYLNYREFSKKLKNCTNAYTFLKSKKIKDAKKVLKEAGIIGIVKNKGYYIHPYIAQVMLQHFNKTSYIEDAFRQPILEVQKRYGQSILKNGFDGVISIPFL